MPGASAEITDQPGTEDDERERHLEEEDRDEGRRREADHDAVLERPLADAHDRLEHHREHRRLQPEEQRRDDADLAPGGVDQAQGHDGDKPRQDEQRAGDEPALRLVQEPADIDRELLRLGAGQEHAIVERVQEPVLAEPALLLDEDAMHHGDLPGRPAEGERGDPRPHPYGLGEGDAVRWSAGGGGRADGRRLRQARGAVVHAGTLCRVFAGAFAGFAGQLCVSSVASRHQR